VRNEKKLATSFPRTREKPPRAVFFIALPAVSFSAAQTSYPATPLPPEPTDLPAE
jgi:hypothetical protein